ncbi:MAG: SCO family protein [Verrucomicrobia bacterium]|nr:SCO family protein [Verrucomicrobiota bacterium]
MKAFLTALCFLAVLSSAVAQNPQAELTAKAGLNQQLNAQVPLNLPFRDEHGTAVRLGNYFGLNPLVLVLAYYQCPNLCTLVLNALLQTAQDLQFDVGKQYQILIVSIDPHESPALAAAKKQIYIQRYGRPGTEDGWHFLTGDEAAVRQLAQSIGYRFVYDPQTRQFAHPSVITVLTPVGKVSRYFAGIEYPPNEVRLALVEASNSHIGSLTDQLFLLCFHYNPTSGKYGLVVTRVIQFGGLSTVLVLGTLITLMIRRESSAGS